MVRELRSDDMWSVLYYVSQADIDGRVKGDSLSDPAGLLHVIMRLWLVYTSIYFW